MTETEGDDLLSALQRRRDSVQWNERIVRESVADPAALKRTAEPCANCEEPCTGAEVCVTALAHEAGLVGTVGREQAFHLVESGVRRARLRGDVAVRERGERRPNRFVSAHHE